MRRGALLVWFGNGCIIAALALPAWQWMRWMQDGAWPSMSARELLDRVLGPFGAPPVWLPEIFAWSLDLWAGLPLLLLGAVALAAGLREGR